MPALVDATNFVTTNAQFTDEPVSFAPSQQISDLQQLVLRHGHVCDRFNYLEAALDFLSRFDHKDTEGLFLFIRACAKSGKLSCGKASILHKLVCQEQDKESLTEANWRYTYGCGKLLEYLMKEAEEMRGRASCLHGEIKKTLPEKNDDGILSRLSEMINWCSSLESTIGRLSTRVKNNENPQDGWRKLEKLYDPVNNYFLRT